MRIGLERRISELSREIRHYPTPIARCDEQLAALLEERSRLMSRLAALDEHGSCDAQAIWVNDGGMHAA
ncbi:MAG: hypothetical protein A3D95_03030 [Betaproteobacteria bacterium RIFCSPHIGHO2_12_FULL_69_13]|nr:MAG: hypothetical protein A3D95_03030 [Betaproteobacteria bacterium RIFCSPHIGHO2_12_FULL_69_13]OGA66872.1 MAG: hypothetical protein A3G83_13275 [Betaproteobacteria bacterium RIFCSPLOWO2_12_FULL_68_20]